MLAYFLSVLVGTGSVGMYFAAFFFPEIYRKQDLLWSGVGLLYALVLWVEAHQLSGGLLVGQIASVLLLGWFAWQNITLRQQLTNFDQQLSPAVQNQSKPPLTSGLEQTEPSVLVNLPQPWIEIRQEFPATERSTDPVTDQDSEP
jgi:Ycf66 protein N-terminus